MSYREIRSACTALVPSLGASSRRSKRLTFFSPSCRFPLSRAPADPADRTLLPTRSARRLHGVHALPGLPAHHLRRELSQSQLRARRGLPGLARAEVRRERGHRRRHQHRDGQGDLPQERLQGVHVQGAVEAQRQEALRRRRVRASPKTTLLRPSPPTFKSPSDRAPALTSLTAPSVPTGSPSRSFSRSPTCSTRRPGTRTRTTRRTRTRRTPRRSSTPRLST